MHGNGRRLTPQEIAERFGRMKRDHEKRLTRSRRAQERRQQRESTEEYLGSQAAVSVGTSIGDTLRQEYRRGMRLRNAKGHFVGLPK